MESRASLCDGSYDIVYIQSADILNNPLPLPPLQKSVLIIFIETQTWLLITT